MRGESKVMNFRQTMKISAGALALSFGLMSFGAVAKASPDEAAKLKSTLTPLGGDKAANADGSIPAWNGGLAKGAAGGGAGKRYTDPFSSDKPKFTISKDNLAQYKDKLTPGQQALFAKYPTYKMPVYETRRTGVAPDFVYEATFKNATSGELIAGGDGVAGAIVGIPFPIPKNGAEVIWNHKLRYRSEGIRRWNNQFALTTQGSYNLVKIQEDALFSYSKKGATPESLNNIAVYFLQITTEPARLAGGILLVHDTINQVKEPRRAFLYNPGQRRLRRAPNVAYDNPGTASDGLRTNDQLDMFNGALDRYDWKLVGKKEVYIPYNSYKLHSDKYKYKDIVTPQHTNQDLTRYELHRVWVVDSTIKKGTNHIYSRRTFYVDEDTWQISAVDVFDQRGQMWRVQEAHPYIAHDLGAIFSAMESTYDLQSARYLLNSLNNEDEETKVMALNAGYFDPANVVKLATK
jgi:hypothetical protein